MADTTTPTTPPVQDLQINLADAPKAEETTAPKIETPELNLDLDLNLPEAPKNDDRLKTEDQKNQENLQKSSDNNLPKSSVEEVLQPTPEIKTEENIPAPVMEPIPVELNEQSEGIPEPAKAEPPIIEGQGGTVVEQPSKVVEEISSSSEILGGNPPESSSLKEDMKMISDLEGTANAGGLAPEAIVEIQPSPAEAPKTFDLDSMLGVQAGNSPDRGRNEEEVVAEAQVTSQPVEQKTEIPGMPPIITATPMETPAFTIPTTTTQVPVQAIMKTTVPQKKNTSVKALLFVMLFVALGFTTFFILKTMYPVEFGNIFGGSQTNMHASEATTGTTEELTGTEFTGTEFTGATEELTGETIDTGTTTDNGFGELNDLGTITAEPEQTDLSRLTDYVNQGNDFLAQGKAINNNTVIKYGLYISKKATSFLEKIANGEEINNLSGYFAQFDQYIGQLKVLVGETPNPDTTVTTPDETVSTSSGTNAFDEMTNITATPDVTTD